MAAITPTILDVAGQGIFKVFSFTDVDDGENYAATATPKAFWAQSTIDPSTNTSAGINVTFDTTNGFTFYPGVDNATVYLFVIY